MRIMIVTDAYPPMIGGATRSAQQLAHQLSARGHNVCVASSWQPRCLVHEQDQRVEVYRLRDLTSRIPGISADPYQHIPPPFPDPEAIVRLRWLIRHFQPDVVHSYGWLTHSCSVALLATGIPLVVSARDYGNVCAVRTLVHDSQPCDGPSPVACLRCAAHFYGPVKGTAAVTGVAVGKRLLRWRLCGLHSVSRYMQSVMHRHLIDPARVSSLVIPNFRDEVRPEPPREDLLALLPTEPFILFVGAFRTVKGIQVLFDAYERLKIRPPLVLVGTRSIDTPYLFPEGATVLEDVPHSTVMAIWRRCLFGVAPSTWPEPLGNVVHEGMSQAKAMIGTTPGGHADMIVDGETGCLVPGGDVVALAEAMQLLIDSPETRQRMEFAARRRARLFTAEIAIPHFERLYESAITRGNRKIGAGRLRGVSHE